MTKRFLLLGLLFIPAGASAQIDIGAGPSTLEFSFSNPGARSMGFAGAFSALADDATAAFANPAGLVQLTRSEVSAEGRLWSYSTPFTEGGRISGEPTGLGLDSTPGLRRAESSEDVSGLSFLSFVYPRKRWALAFYRHELANFRAVSETQGFFGEGSAPGVIIRPLDRRVSTDLQVVSHGISAAYKLSDRLSFGAGLAHITGEAVSAFRAFAVDDPARPDNFGPISYLPERLVASLDLTLDDTDWALNMGLLWRISRHWNLGGVFRKGPAFRFVAGETVAGPGFELFGVPEGTIVRPGSETPIELPDVFGLGLAYRSEGGALSVSLEWDRVEYSAITDSFDPRVIDSRIRLFDGDELRLGFEYVFVQSQPIVALRLGAWLDPDHTFHFVGGDDSFGDTFSRALFTGGGDELHYAAGLGFVFKGFQVDVAVDLSKLRDTASVSAIYSF